MNLKLRGAALVALIAASPWAVAQDAEAPVERAMKGIEMQVNRDAARFARSGRVRHMRMRSGLMRESTLDVDLMDQTVTLIRDRIEKGPGNSVTWIGHVKDVMPSEVVLTQTRGKLSGSVRMRSRLFEITSDRSGNLIVFEVDTSRLPVDVEVSPDTIPGYIATTPRTAFAPPVAGDVQVIDLLAVYTPRSCNRYGREADGSCPGIEAKILSAVADANLAYQNSNMDVQLNLVEVSEVAYNETGNMSVSLDHLRGKNDGQMDSVHQLRDDTGADIVAMVTEDANYCGIGYVMSRLSPSFESLAFNVTFSTCLSSQTLAHEIGHNMGSQHDRDSAGFQGIAPYAYGYRQCGFNGYESVMAYACAGSSGVSYFSNPSVNLPDGRPTGTATENNARSISETAATVAAFRSGGNNNGAPPSSPAYLAIATVSSSSLALSWTDRSDDETGFHIERAPQGGSFARIASLTANTTQYVDNGLVADTAYQYRIQAYNSAGVSGFSPSASGRTATEDDPASAPGAPTAFTATVNSNQSVRLGWVDEADTETSYELTRNGAVIANLPANTTMYTDTGTSAGNTYTWSLKAVNAAGASDPATTTVTIDDDSSEIMLRIRTIERSNRYYIIMAWTGATGTTVDVLYNGRRIGSTRNDGRARVVSRRAIQGTLQICERGSSNCSDPVQIQ